MSSQISNQPIVRDNLMIYYDAATPLCYNYTGTGQDSSSFYNLAGGTINGSVGLYYVGANVYNKSGLGSFKWDNFNLPGSTNMGSLSGSFTGSFTVQFWIQPDYTSIGSMFYPPMAINTMLYGQSYTNATGWDILHYSGSDGYKIKFEAAFSTTFLRKEVIRNGNQWASGSWINYAISWDQSSTSAGSVSIYTNGKLETSFINLIDGVGTYIKPNAFGGVWDYVFGDGGSRGFGYMFGYMACMLHYNRILSATEVAQNFNAQKARFGITS
jgi:hypothetical protein